MEGEVLGAAVRSVRLGEEIWSYISLSVHTSDLLNSIIIIELLHLFTVM